MTLVADLGAGLVLRGLQCPPLHDREREFAPASWLVHEWRDYAVEWAEGVPARPPIELSELTRAHWRQVGGAAVFAIANQLGLARLVVRAGSIEVPLTLEVLSPKFPTASAHRAFYGPLVRQLADWAASLPFTLDEATAIRTAESTRPRSDLFAWHFLRQEGESILAALRLVLSEPRRQLTLEDRIVGIAESASLDERTLLDIARHPERMVPVPATAAAHGWPLADRLRQVRSGRAFLPRELSTWRAEETLDTPEHRFVKAFAADLANTAERLLTRTSLPVVGRRDIRGFSGEIRDALGTTWLTEVGPLTAFPWASRILQRADGYRDLLQAWRKYQHARDPFESLVEATDVRDVATLYEWWCFFALVHRISEVEPFVSLGTGVDEFEGVRYGICASFADGWTLTFNRSFGHGSGTWQSYSVPLRPDYILAHGSVPLVALDAKFRFDSTDWEIAQESTDEVLRAEGDDVRVSAQRLAKQADIYKMHTYRDALRLRSCVVVYPGGKHDQAVFYAREQGKHTGWSLDYLLSEQSPFGVGSFPLSPEHA